MPVQCNIISLIDLLQDISTFVTVGCRQIKKLKRLLDLTFGTPKQCKLQKHPLRVVLRKIHLSKNLVWIVAPLKMWSKPWNIHLREFIFGLLLVVGLHIYSKINFGTYFSTVLAQLQSTHFIEHLPVVYSASVGFIKRRSSGVIQPNDCKLQSQ